MYAFLSALLALWNAVAGHKEAYAALLPKSARGQFYALYHSAWYLTKHLATVFKSYGVYGQF